MQEQRPPQPQQELHLRAGEDTMTVKWPRTPFLSSHLLALKFPLSFNFPQAHCSPSQISLLSHNLTSILQGFHLSLFLFDSSLCQKDTQRGPSTPLQVYPLASRPYLSDFQVKFQETPGLQVAYAPSSELGAENVGSGNQSVQVAVGVSQVICSLNKVISLNFNY